MSALLPWCSSFLNVGTQPSQRTHDLLEGWRHHFGIIIRVNLHDVTSSQPHLLVVPSLQSPYLHLQIHRDPPNLSLLFWIQKHVNYAWLANNAPPRERDLLVSYSIAYMRVHDQVDKMRRGSFVDSPARNVTRSSFIRARSSLAAPIFTAPAFPHF